jgi:hypothetical protein
LQLRRLHGGRLVQLSVAGSPHIQLANLMDNIPSVRSLGLILSSCTPLKKRATAATVYYLDNSFTLESNKLVIDQEAR